MPDYKLVGVAKNIDYYKKFNIYQTLYFLGVWLVKGQHTCKRHFEKLRLWNVIGLIFILILKEGGGGYWTCSSVFEDPLNVSLPWPQ